MTEVEIEDLIPHRGTMKLVDEILEVDSNHAVTKSVANESWPLIINGFVSPVVILELIAQTAGISFGYKDLIKENKKDGGRGMLVGIKKAEFLIDGIPLQGEIITEATVTSPFEGYVELNGSVTVNGKPAGNAVIRATSAE